jgi:hypothetical protein
MTVSVRLRGNPSQRDYEKLRELMETARFRPYFDDDKRRKWELPQGVFRYTASTTEDIDFVANAAENIAQRVRAGPQIVVTKGEMMCRNLDPIEEKKG